MKNSLILSTQPDIVVLANSKNAPILSGIDLNQLTTAVIASGTVTVKKLTTASTQPLIVSLTALNISLHFSPKLIKKFLTFSIAVGTFSINQSNTFFTTSSIIFHFSMKPSANA